MTETTAPQQSAPTNSVQDLLSSISQEEKLQLVEQVLNDGMHSNEPTEDDQRRALEIKAFIARNKGKAIASGQTWKLLNGLRDLIQLQEVEQQAISLAISGGTLRRNPLLRRVGLNQGMDLLF